LVANDLEERALSFVDSKLDYYVKSDNDFKRQDSTIQCDNDGSRLVAGACEGWNGSPQASVGPVYEIGANGKPQIHCMRFSSYQTKATAFCFRIKKAVPNDFTLD
jgi:hypothetical protein